jgi:hypothetical protein
VAAEVIGHPDECVAVLKDDQMGKGLVSFVVESLLPQHPRLAARVLEARTTAYAHLGKTVTVVLDRARALVAAGSVTDAETLLRAVEEHAVFVASGLQVDSVDGDAFLRSRARARARIRRRLSMCRRAVGDFRSAREELAEIDCSLLNGPTRAEVEAEYGLIDAEVAVLVNVRFPRDEGEARSMLDRLCRGAARFGAALEAFPSEPRAAYCLGLIAACEQRHGEAARLLEVAAAALAGDPLYEDSGFLTEMVFHRSFSELLTLEPGRDTAAFRGMLGALDAGFVPSSSRLAEAAEGLEAYASPHTGEFLLRVSAVADPPGPVVAHVAAAARAADDAGIAAAVSLAARDGLSGDSRFDLLEAALLGAGRRGDVDTVARIAERTDDVIVDAVSDRLDDRWIDLLGSSDQLRDTLGPTEAELERVNAMRRRGRMDEAAEVVRRLFYRAAAGALGRYDPSDLLQLFEELGGSVEHRREMQAAIPATTGALERPVDPVARLLERQEVRLLFVGGNETQRSYRSTIDADLVERYDGRVTVEWFDGAWNVRWMPLAEKAESGYRSAHALVIMSMVRTNLGKRLRKSAGEAGLPWIPCTGTGRASIRAAIDRAVKVIVENGRGG